jgi:hypothetical protein
MNDAMAADTEVARHTRQPEAGPNTKPEAPLHAIGRETEQAAHTIHEPRVTGVAAAARAILDFLTTNPGKYAKSSIISRAGIERKDWNRAIKQLLEEGRVKSEGLKKGAKYWV